MHFVGEGGVYGVGWGGQVRYLASVGGLAMDWLGSMLDWDAMPTYIYVS
jgi:hypothetical protein